MYLKAVSYTQYIEEVLLQQFYSFVLSQESKSLTKSVFALSGTLMQMRQ